MGALGHKAKWLVEDHSLNFGLGKNSPLEKLCKSGSKVMLIGSDLDNVTLLHYAEAICPLPEKKIVRIKVPLADSGKTKWADVEEYNSSTGIKNWPDNFFADIVQEYIHFAQPQSGFIGKAKSYSLDAQSLLILPSR